jgi:branched-chain amino acid transport system permease protein
MTKNRSGLIVAALVALGLATVPWWHNAVLLQFGINTLQLAVMAQAWNIIGGYTGSPSFGNSTFYGLGTYGTAIAMAQFHQSFGLGLAIGAVLAVITALLVGIPILRLRGPYFAIATLGLAATMGAIVANLPIAGENIGLVLPLTRDEPLFYELSLALLVLATLTVLFIDRSRFGLGLIAIREDEDAAAVTGVNTTLFKVAALALSAFFTALVGGIHAYWITFIDPSSAFDPKLNVTMVIMAVFGGPGTVLGPVVGAFILAAISEVLSSHISTAASLLFGIVIVLAVLFMPKGLVDLGYGFRRVGWRYFTETIRQYRL